MDNRNNSVDYTLKLLNWWVEFHPESGKIHRISPREIKSREGFIVFETNNAICEQIVTGSFNTRNCFILHNEEDNTWDISEKSNTIILDNDTTTLYNVTETGLISNKELMLNVYKNQGLVDVILNKQLITNKFNLSDIRQIKQQGGDHFTLYITRKNNPDHLLEVLYVDTLELFENNRVRLQSRFINEEWQGLSIYTRPVLNLYGIEYYEDILDTDEINFRNRITNVASVTGGYHLGISNYRGRSVIIKRNMIEGFESAVSNIKSFDLVICDNEVDKFVGGIRIKPQDLLKNEEIKVNLKFVFPNKPVILYKNKRIAVKYLGEVEKWPT